MQDTGNKDLKPDGQTVPVMNAPHPTEHKGLLNPVERISEILFGLIMALTFTGTISIVSADRAEVRDMLIGAIGCNIAWGLVDAVMYIMGTLTERGRGRTILLFVKSTSDEKKARYYIADSLPPVVASTMQTADLEQIRKALTRLPDESLKVRLTWKDFKTAFGIFLLVFLSTFPVVIPFALISELQIALRVSNLVAIILMFVSGWLLASYGGYNKWIMGLSLTLLGVVLVLITIALGG